MFDPYHKWLGIPKDQRPPTHYQLLGIAAGETDTEVIDEAAVRQTTHVRAYQIGAHAADCTRLLNEIAQAKTTLLNPAKRKAYDEQLEKAKASQFAAMPMATAIEPAPSAFAFDEPEERPRAAPPPLPPRRDLDIAKPTKNPTMMWVLIGAGGGVLLLLIAIVAIALAPRPVPAPQLPLVVVGKKDDAKPPVEPGQDKVQPPPVINNPPIVANPPIKKPPAKAVDPVKPGKGPITVRWFKAKEGVKRMSLSADGQKLAIAGNNPYVHEVPSGKLLATFPWPNKPGAVWTCVAMLPSGARALYSYGCDPAAVLGDAVTGAPVARFESPDGHAFGMAVAPDGKRALAGFFQHLVYLDLENQKELKRWERPQVAEIVFAPDGKSALTCQLSGGLARWDLERLEKTAERTEPKLVGVRSLTISADGKTALAGATDGLAFIELPSLRAGLINFPNRMENFRALALTNDGKLLYAAGQDGKLRRLRLEGIQGTLLGGGWDFHEAEVTRLALDAQERFLVSADLSGKVVVWPLKDAVAAAAPPPANPGDPQPAPPPGLKKIGEKSLGATYRLAILPDGKSFISGGTRLTHWDTSGKQIRQIARKNSVSSRLAMSVSSDGRVAAWGENKFNPAVFDIATGNELGRIVHDGDLGALAVSPDGTLCCAAFNDKSLTIWDVAKQKSIQEFPIGDRPYSMVFAPDGKHLVLCLISGQSQWFDTATWQAVGAFNVGPFASHPAFSTDGQILALASARGIALIDMVKLQPIADLPHAKVQQLAFCAKGQLLLSVGSSESTIAVWDVAQRAKIAQWELPEAIYTFGVDPMETLIVASTRSAGAYTWPLPKDRQEIAAPAGQAAAAPPLAAPSAPPGLERMFDTKVASAMRVEILPDNKSFIGSGGPAARHTPKRIPAASAIPALYNSVSR